MIAIIKMTSKYKTGQKVIGIKGVGTRTIVKCTNNKIWWRSGKKSGACKINSFKNWQKGKNTAKYRSR